MKRSKILAVAALAVLCGGAARAQATPKATPVPPDETPSVRIGATIFA